MIAWTEPMMSSSTKSQMWFLWKVW